jgi:queuosine precursor transporter
LADNPARSSFGVNSFGNRIVSEWKRGILLSPGGDLPQLGPKQMKPAILYVLAVLVANLTATAFFPFPDFGQVAVGTLVFGVTFTQRDRMHRAGGRRLVYKTIAVAAALTLALLLSGTYLWGEPLTDYFHSRGWNWLAAGSGSLAQGGPRVFVASFLAIVLAETADTEIYHHLRERSWAVRVLHSNAVSIPMDSVLFNCVAFAGLFAPTMLAQIVFGEVVVKFSVSAVYALLPQKLRPGTGPEGERPLFRASPRSAAGDCVGPSTRSM